jgi:hypothetical protein
MKVVQAIFWGSVAAAAFIVWGLFFAVPAKAQINLAEYACSQMDNIAGADNGVTDQEITNVLHSMFRMATPEEAGQALAYAVTNLCPWWTNAFTEYFTELENGEFVILDDGTVVYTRMRA